MRTYMLGMVLFVSGLLFMIHVFMNDFDLFFLLLFGYFGRFMKYVRLPPAPFILAFISGPLIENSFGQSLKISYGGLWILGRW